MHLKIYLVHAVISSCAKATKEVIDIPVSTMSVFKENPRLVNHLHSDIHKESWEANIGVIMLMKRSFPVAEQ